MFAKTTTKIMDQDFVVREYFTKIAEEDPYGLDIHGFFERVCNSIVNNGLEKTCEIYIWICKE